MQTHHSSLLQQLSMYSYCALPFQKSNRICHAIFRRYAQAQVYMVIHRVPFQQPNALLFAKLSQDLAYCCPKSPKYYLLSIFRYEHHVILALPTHMRQTFKVFHTLFLLPIRAFPGGRDHLIFGSPERLNLQGSHGQWPWVWMALKWIRVNKRTWTLRFCTSTIV